MHSQFTMNAFLIDSCSLEFLYSFSSKLAGSSVTCCISLLSSPGSCCSSANQFWSSTIRSSAFCCSLCISFFYLGLDVLLLVIRRWAGTFKGCSIRDICCVFIYLIGQRNMIERAKGWTRLFFRFLGSFYHL